MNAGWNAVWMNRRGREKTDDNLKGMYEVGTEDELFEKIKEINLGYDGVE